VQTDYKLKLLGCC